MKLREHLVLSLLVLALPMTSGGQECPTLIDVPCFYNRKEASVWFGWHPQGGVSSLGQTITIECPTRILGLDLQFDLGTMVEGDTVQADRKINRPFSPAARRSHPGHPSATPRL